MRVLILSQYYHPEPVPKPEELAEGFGARGHDVSVITGFPIYPRGRLYDGWRMRWRRRETVRGIPVTRMYEFPYHGEIAWKRMLNHVSFMLSAPFGLLGAPPCDAIYVWHPPLTIGVAAALMARLRRVPFIYDVQDIWPDEVVLAGVMRDGLLVRWLARLERLVYRCADHLLVVTEGARANLIGKGVPPEKVTVMPHWVDEALFAPQGDGVRAATRRALGLDDRFVVLFAGNLGIVQGLDTVIAAARLLHDEERITFVLLGDGTDRARLQAQAEQAGVGERVRFIARQPRERMPAHFAAADALLVHLKRSPVAHLVLPTKTLAYLASGKPILMAMQGAAAELIEKAQAGLVVEPEDPARLVAAARELRDLTAEARAAMGANGRAYLVRHYAKDKVLTLYEELIARVTRTEKGAA
jgi:glycosyltransferase involved in cell wall biosynthesis